MIDCIECSGAGRVSRKLRCSQRPTILKCPSCNGSGKYHYVDIWRNPVGEVSVITNFEVWHFPTIGLEGVSPWSAD